MNRTSAFVSIVAASAAMLAARPGAAAACTAVALRDTTAVYAPYQIDAGRIDPRGAHLSRGEIVDELTQYDVSTKTGLRVVCMRGAACYPAQFLKLRDCVPGPAQPRASGSPDVLHALIPTHSSPSK